MPDDLKSDLESAAWYRKHAEELRAIAADMFDPKSKKTLLRVADDYDRMAVSRERLAETERVLRPNSRAQKKRPLPDSSR